MEYWDMIFEAYREMVMAGQVAHQECLSLIGEWRFDEAEKIEQSRKRYYDCAKTALKML